VALARFVSIAQAQDSIKISAGYLNTEFQANPIESIEYLKGYYAEVDGRIFKKNGWRLGAVINYQKAYNVEVVPAGEVYPMGLYRNVQTFSFGARLSKKIGPIEPFGAFLLGFRKPHGDTNDAINYEPVRKYQVGGDILLGNFFIRPIFIEFEATGGFGDTRTQKYGAGAGLRF
jgi:hypothetical protein